VAAVAAGTYHGLAVKNDGTVWAWGGNGDGQLGDGSTTQRLSPVPASGLADLDQAAAGAWHSLAAVTRRPQATRYGYDALYRLTSERAPGLLTTYAYDPVGNHTGRTRGGATVTEAFDKADRLATTGDLVDANGNVTSRGPTTLGYDAADRLVSMASSPYVGVTYSYAGDGARVARTTIGAPETNTFHYVYDRGGALPALLQETAATAATTTTTATRRYVWGAAGLAYVVAGSGSGTASVVHADGLGSVRALTDGTGEVTQTYRTDAFGVLADLPEGSNPPTQPFRFAGEQWDYEKAGAGLVFLRARMYDPDLGRSLT
jgi:YD repeat-containing protein